LIGGMNRDKCTPRLEIRITQSFLSVLNTVDKFFDALLASNKLCLLLTIQSSRSQLAGTRHCDTE
jgi:hypothetical protein